RRPDEIAHVSLGAERRLVVAFTLHAVAVRSACASTSCAEMRPKAGNHVHQRVRDPGGRHPDKCALNLAPDVPNLGLAIVQAPRWSGAGRPCIPTEMPSRPRSP